MVQREVVIFLALVSPEELTHDDTERSEQPERNDTIA
jgi:hypothetical protein